MATGPNSAGIDVAAIVGPLVDVGFTLAGTAKPTGTLTIGGKPKFDTVKDVTVLNGAVVLTVPVIPFKRQDQEGSTDVTSKQQSVLVNVDDLRVAAAKQGLSCAPTIKDNDTVVIKGVKWTVFDISNFSDAMLELRVRR